MAIQRAREFTIKRLFLGDTLLNWFLGGMMTFFPALVDRLLGSGRLLPVPVYQVFGAGFLLFAAWQTWILARRRMGAWALIFAGIMALGPFIGLTIALVFVDFALYPGWRIALWVGNLYMLVLGIWYLYLARMAAKEKAAGDPAGT